jgi:acyl-CoA synthetase (NDP forming)
MSAFHDLQPLIAPRSIAVVGASENPGPGLQVLENIRRLGFQGPVYPVNPRYPSVQGLDCYPSLSAVRDAGHEVDLVAILLGRNQVLGVLEEAGRAGARAAWAFASGFAEAGEEGRAMQEELAGICRRHSLRFCGPNCVGLLNFNGRTGAYSAPAPREIIPGGIGVVAQSGYVSIQLANANRGLGYSMILSAGNEAVVDAADYLEYLVEDPGTRVIAAFIEQFRRPERLPEIARRARAAGKPILLIKVGRSETARRASAAHTGALAGADDVQEAVFRRLGLTRLEDLDELLETAELFDRLGGRLPAGDGLFATTLSGGVIGLLGDLGEPLGLRFPAWSEEGKKRVAAQLPPYASVENPLDAWGFGRVEQTYAACLQAAAEEPSADLLLVSQDVPGGMAPRQVAQYAAVARAAAEVAARTDKPVVFLSNPSTGFDPEIRRILGEAGVPLLQGTREGLRAVRHLIDRARFLRAPGRPPAPPRLPAPLQALLEGPARGLTEYDSKQVLAGYGVPCAREKLCASPEEAAAFARELGGRVALKVMSPDILHKTDSGILALNLAGEEAVRAAYPRLLEAARRHLTGARLQGVLCQQMVEGAVAEVIVGILNDPQWGPVVVFGTGGVLVEVLGDRSLAAPSLDEQTARDMIRSTRGSRLLEGFRGRPRGDLQALARLLVSVGDLALELGGRLEALDLNPVLVLPEGRGVVAVDARLYTRNLR